MKRIFGGLAIMASIVITASCQKGSDPEETVEDLSINGTANCYVVPEAGKYKFKATKGNTDEAIDGITTSYVLWESFGTDETPSTGDVVATTGFSGGYVWFSTPETLQDGNAVIAVKDADDNILWSWHIWVCEGFDPEDSAHVYNNNAGTVMDRVIGATSAQKGDVRSIGLLYQWGRKDPFIGMCDTSASTTAATTIVWPAPVFSDATQGTISYATTNPTTFIIWGSNGDWYYTPDMTTDDERWRPSNLSKGVYDPCPAGWRVPDGSSDSIWTKAFGSELYVDDGPWDNSNKGMDFGSGNGLPITRQLGTDSVIWYPASGYKGGTGVSQACGKMGYVWTASPEGRSASCMFYDNECTIGTAGIADRAQAFSVRCVKDNSVR